MRLLESPGHVALRQAYLERRSDLVRFFTARLKSAAAAEDLVQDIYVRVAAVPADAEIRAPAAFLYRLGSNLMLDRLRGERRAAARDAAWREGQRTVLGAEEVAEDPSAEQALAARQRLAVIVAALEALPPLTQRAFVMHKFDGLSHAEVAAALSISRSAVEKHIMAVLKHLTRSAL